MSYAVLHMQKIKMGGIRGIQNHNERLKESKTNLDIDYSKSHLNMDLMDPDDRTYYMRIKERINELNLNKAVRKDAVVACGFVCTSDKSFFEKLDQEEKNKFFKESYKFLKERYGEKNVIASKVHYDEVTPHLHCYIMPVTDDGRLSAKSIFTPKELRELQTEYHVHLKTHGFDLERGLEGSTNKHIEMTKFKLKTSYSELEKVSKSLDVLNLEYNKIKSEFNNYLETLSAKDNLKEQLDPYKEQFRNIVSPYKLKFENKIAESVFNKALDTALKDKIILEKSKIDELESFINSFINTYKENLEIINSSNLILKKYKVFEKENSRLESKIYRNENVIDDLKKENLDFKNRIRELSKTEKTFNLVEKYLQDTDQVKEVNEFIEKQRKTITRNYSFQR